MHKLRRRSLQLAGVTGDFLYRYTSTLDVSVLQYSCTVHTKTYSPCSIEGYVATGVNIRLDEVYRRATEGA